LTITINQNQDLTLAPLYKLPVFIDIYAEGKKDRKQIWIEDAKNTFTFTVDKQPDLVNFDAERQLLAKIDFAKTKQELVFQYKNAPLWGDRDEAMSFFSEHANDSDIQSLLMEIAINDPWKNIRSQGIAILATLAKEKESELKPLLVRIYHEDKNTRVRALALKTLALQYKGDDLNALYEQALNEQSYAIVSEGFDAIASLNPSLAMKKATALENEASKDLMYSIMDLYAKQGTDENHSYFIKIKKQFSGFELMSFGNLYGKFLKRCTKSETVIDGAKVLTKLASSDNKYVKYAAQKVIKDNLMNVWQGKEDKLNGQIDKLKKENQDVTTLNAELKVVKETKKQIK
jgi:aminopeptidase N